MPANVSLWWTESASLSSACTLGESSTGRINCYPPITLTSTSRWLAETVSETSSPITAIAPGVAYLSVVEVSRIAQSPVQVDMKYRNKLSEMALFSWFSDCNILARFSKL